MRLFYYLSILLIIAQSCKPSQFVLFEKEFVYTKENADNSSPSKSHYYITESDLNPNRPKNWIFPIDYRNGTAHIRLEVLEKPAGNEPTTWTICYIPNKGTGNGYGCTGTDLYVKEGVYEKIISMNSFWENQSIIWSEGIKEIDLIIKDSSGGQGHAHKRSDFEKFFPTKIKISVIQVAAGKPYKKK